MADPWLGKRQAVGQLVAGERGAQGIVVHNVPKRRVPAPTWIDSRTRPLKGATMADSEQAASPPPETSGGGDRRLDFRPGMGMWEEIIRSTDDTSRGPV